jgi:transposase
VAGRDERDRWMRGTDERSGKLFSYVDLEQRVPARHPLRAIRGLVNEALADIGPELEAVYSRIGRPLIAPERLLQTLLLQLFHGIRSERQMMERLNFDLSFRCFVGLGIDDPVWDASTFSKNRERLLDGEIAARFLSAILARPQVKRLLSAEHFSVDGTLIEAWCSMKRGRLPRYQARQRYSCLDHRSRRATVSQESRGRREAVLYGARPDGEPQRARGRCRDHAGGRLCRPTDRGGDAR